MRIAFISDIHGNLTALQAVLADIQERSVDQIVCLGDTITMGPQPAEVLKLLRELKCVCVKGNHEAATLDPEHSAQYEVASHAKDAQGDNENRYSEIFVDLGVQPL